MSQPLLWTKQLESAAEYLKEVPLWGAIPPFPWDILKSSLQDLFDLPDLSLSAKEGAWLSQEEIEESLGEASFFKECTLSPLGEKIGFCFSQKSAEYVFQLLLTPDHKLKSLSQNSIFEGFSHFIFLYLIDAFNQASPYEDLQISLLSSQNRESFFSKGAFCLDISLHTGKWPISLKMLCPSQTHQALQRHFKDKKETSWLVNSKANLISVPLSLQSGTITLTHTQLSKLCINDLVILEQSLFDPEHQKGRALLCLGETSLFTVKIKESEIKIIDYALSQFTTPHKEPVYMDKSLSSSEDEDSDETESSSEALVSSKDIPISITVELARLSMPLGKLAELKPGNLLDLPWGQGQDSVYLTVSGKRIAKAELVKLGEVVGAKILSIGE